MCNKSGKSAFFNKFLYKRKKSEKWTFFYVQFKKNLRIIKKKKKSKIKSFTEIKKIIFFAYYDISIM